MTDAGKPIRLIMICAGRHGHVVLETIRITQLAHLVACFDDDGRLQGSKCDEAEVVGPVAMLAGWLTAHSVDAAILGLGNLKLLEVRRTLYESARQLGLKFASVIHPSSTIAASAEVSDGFFAAPQTVVHSFSRVGRNVSMYSGSTIDHDNIVGDHVFLGPGVHTAGLVTIGDDAYLGPGVIVGSGVSIGRGSIIGAGSVVLHDIPDGVVAYGVPAVVRGQVRSWKH